MPYLNGPLSNGWAVIDVLIGVSAQRHQLLEKHQFAIPDAVHVRALIDTGASLSGFSPRVFRELDLTPVTTMKVLTPSTPAHAPLDCNLFDVGISLVADGRSHPFPDMRVMEADCWLPDEGLEALIGMDILMKCNFQLLGPEQQFYLAFNP